MSKTIKQIADELGISKQAIQKRISREPLYTSIQPYILTVGGTKYIEVAGENLIKSVISEKSRQPVDDNMSIEEDNKMYTSNQSIIDVLKETIDVLQGQLEIKDKQIEELNLRLAEAHAISDNAQQLQKGQMILNADETKLITDKKEKKRHWWQKRKK